MIAGLSGEFGKVDPAFHLLCPRFAAVARTLFLTGGWFAGTAAKLAATATQRSH